MKIERLSQDKIRIFLTFDDLTERGIKKEEMWRELPKVRDLFTEMMDQAYSEVGFDASGPLAVEVFTLPAQGMVVIVTRGKTEADRDEDFDDLEEDQIYEMEVTLEQSDVVSFLFSDFEHVISAARRLILIPVEGGSLYKYKDNWILQLEPCEMEERTFQYLIALLSEFGAATSINKAVLEEYGQTIIADGAIKTLCQHFN